MPRRKLPAAVQAAVDAQGRRDEHQLAPRAARIALTLPFPPSTNHLYRTFIGPSGRPMRAKTARAKQYAEAVGSKLLLWRFEHGRRPPLPPYRLLVRAYPPDDKRKHDLSNTFKLLEDSLIEAINQEDGVKVDDDDVRWIYAVKMDPSADPRVEVVLEGGTG